MAIRMGKWQCPNCLQENDGPAELCAHCGFPKPANVRYYLPGDAPPINDPVKIAEAKSGPKWTCTSCGSPNSQTVDDCVRCGRPRPDDAPNFPIRDYAEGEVPNTADEAKEIDYAEEVRTVADLGVKSNPLADIRDVAVDHLNVIGATALAVITLFAGIWFFSPHQEEMTITDFQWTRDVSIEVYKTVQLEAWEGELPSDARVLSHSSEIYTYNQVACGSHVESYQDCQEVASGSETYSCGSRDLGNGYFEDQTCSRTTYTTQCTTENRTVTDYCSVPVYREKYLYEAERWVPSRAPHTDGHGQSPIWPQFNLESNERESGRTESYSVTLVDKKEKRDQIAVDYGTWQAYRLGQTLTVQVNRLGLAQIVKEDK